MKITHHLPLLSAIAATLFAAHALGAYTVGWDGLTVDESPTNFGTVVFSNTSTVTVVDGDSTPPNPFSGYANALYADGDPGTNAAGFFVGSTFLDGPYKTGSIELEFRILSGGIRLILATGSAGSNNNRELQVDFRTTANSQALLFHPAGTVLSTTSLPGTQLATGTNYTFTINWDFLAADKGYTFLLNDAYIMDGDDPLFIAATASQISNGLPNFGIRASHNTQSDYFIGQFNIIPEPSHVALFSALALAFATVLIRRRR